MLRYSQIIGTAFYNIQLDAEGYARVDAHFVAANQHRFNAIAAAADGCSGIMRFHQDLYWGHIEALLRTVMSGDFRHAVDLTGRGLDAPGAWSPSKRLLAGQPGTKGADSLLPDPEMFVHMYPDRRYGQGEHHPYDELLARRDLAPHQISLHQACA